MTKNDYQKIFLVLLLVLILLGGVYLEFGLEALIVSELATLVVIGVFLFRYLRRVEKIFTRGQQDLYYHLESLDVLHSHLDFRYPLPPLGHMTLSPPVLRRLVEEIFQDPPTLLVEFGSGVSTVVLAQALSQVQEGRIHTVDHDPSYAERTRGRLQREGLSNRVTVHEAPLVEISLNGRGYRWYDIELEDFVRETIDLLIVDGPPGIPGQRNREPALYRAESMLSPSASILVDDTHRNDERDMVDAWLEHHPEFHEESVVGDDQALLLRRSSRERPSEPASH